jgi:phage terminase small subunit
MTRELSKKQKGFVKDYVETGNGTQSALNNYDTKDYSTAGNIASENLEKPKIQDAIRSIAEQIPDNLLVEKHLELLKKREKVFKNNNKTGVIEEVGEDIDAFAVKSALDMAYKLKGSYSPEKKDITLIEIEADRKKLEEILKSIRE